MGNSTTQTSYPNGKASDKKEASVAETAAAHMQDAADQIREKANVAVQQGSAELKRAADGSAQFVKENPGLAMAGALGLGLLIGLSLRSRY